MNEFDTKYQLFKRATGEMVATYARKNTDYGDSFTTMRREYGWRYPLIHLEEKLARVKSILLHQGGSHQVKEETAKDSLLDLANYAIMTIIEIEEGEQKRRHTDNQETPTL